jgi:hypothetical protein
MVNAAKASWRWRFARGGKDEVVELYLVVN